MWPSDFEPTSGYCWGVQYDWILGEQPWGPVNLLLGLAVHCKPVETWLIHWLREDPSLWYQQEQTGSESEGKTTEKANEWRSGRVQHSPLPQDIPAAEVQGAYENMCGCRFFEGGVFIVISFPRLTLASRTKAWCYVLQSRWPFIWKECARWKRYHTTSRIRQIEYSMLTIPRSYWEGSSASEFLTGT